MRPLKKYQIKNQKSIKTPKRYFSTGCLCYHIMYFLFLKYYRFLLKTEILLALLEMNEFDFSIDEREIEIPDNSWELFPTAMQTRLNISNIVIYEFATNEEVQWYSTGISSCGSQWGYPAIDSAPGKIPAVMVWGEIQWFKHDLLIVRVDYSSFRASNRLLDFFTDLLGEPFAGPER